MTASPLAPEFIQRLKQIIAPQFYEAVLLTFTTKKYFGARINTLKGAITEVQQEMANAGIPFEVSLWSPHALILPHSHRTACMQTSAYLEGKLYFQDLASQLASLALDPQPGEEILDLTAAPGSKTSHIAALMQNQGRIAAVEKSRKRFFKLKQNLEHLGVTNTDVYNKDGRQVWRHCSEQFDRVLLDAPCSSEARFNVNDPESYRYWNEKKIKEMARNQWTLLNSAMLSLKPGGVLVYSTCSFAPEENEKNIARLLKKYQDSIEIEPITIALKNSQPGLTSWKDRSFPKCLELALRIIPNEQMSGFFICRIKKQKYWC